jgi:hypothetical protein
VRNLVLLVLFTYGVSFCETGIIPYISPGINVAWNSGGTVSLTPKISLGVLTKANTPLTSYFCNFTFGKRFLRHCRNSELEYSFTEGEFGIVTGGMLFSGVGAGTAFIRNDSGLHVVPKGSLFTGDILFLRTDAILFNKKLDVDVGGTIVLPLSPYLFSGSGFRFFSGEY